MPSDKNREKGKGSMVQDLEKSDKKLTFHKKGGVKIQGWERDKTFLVGYTMSFYGDKINNHDRRNSTFFNFTFCG